MDTRQLQQAGAKIARDYWRTIPDAVTVPQAVAMPKGSMVEMGRRNLTLRKALGIRFPSKTQCKINAGDVIEVVHPSKGRAAWLVSELERQLPGWAVGMARMSHGPWLVAAYRPDTRFGDLVG